MKKTTIFSFVYFGIFFLLIAGLLNQNHLLQFVTKVSLVLVLLLLYFSENLGKKRNGLYILMLLFVCAGQLFFIEPDTYFSYTLYCYLITHILFSVIIYTKYLKRKSSFDIFTFSLPFLLTFSIIYIMLENLSFWWRIRALVFGPICCINGTITILNYLETKNRENFFLFVGIFIWLVVDALAMVYMFNLKEELYHNIIVILDAIANYLVCIGFAKGLSKKDSDYGFLRI